MPSTLPALHLGTRIERDWQEVYDYLSRPANFNAWAAGLGHSLREENGIWLCQGPAGPVRLRFSPRNEYGVADHWVETAPGVVIYVPLRVVASGGGCEVVLTLFRQPAMSEADLAADAWLVRRDLATLKALLES